MIYCFIVLSFNVVGGDGYLKIIDYLGYVNIGFVDVEVLKDYFEVNSLIDVNCFVLVGEIVYC